MDHELNAIRLEKELHKWRTKAVIRQNLINYIKDAITYEMNRLPTHTDAYEILGRIKKASE